MSTRVFLSNVASDVSGYLVAFIGTRGPTAALSTTVGMTATSTATVITATTTIAMTLTAGGTAAKWITYPIRAAVTISNPPVSNVWAKEDLAADNAAIGFSLAQYTTSLQTQFVITSPGVELTTTQARNAWVSNTAGGKEVITSTAFAAGDRLAITPGLVSVGTMATGGIVYMDYAGGTPGADGDTYIDFNETFNAGVMQYAAGAQNPIPGGPTVVSLETSRQLLQPIVSAAFSDDIPWGELFLQLGYMEDNQTA